MTTALVLFGLVPASIVAYFAYQSSEEFKDKQRLLIGQAALTIAKNLAPIMQESEKMVARKVTVLKFDEKTRKIASGGLSRTPLTAFKIAYGPGFRWRPDKPALGQAADNGTVDVNVENTDLEARYFAAAKEAGEEQNDTTEIEADVGIVAAALAIRHIRPRSSAIRPSTWMASSQASMATGTWS